MAYMQMYGNHVRLWHMRVALYCRVSTVDQNCEMQLRELREYAKTRKWKITAEYVDTGWSGTKANRPELNRLMADARARRLDAVLVWKLDRWGRSIRDSINSIQELVGLGVRFIAVTQNLDTDESNPMAQVHAPHHGRVRRTGAGNHQGAGCSGCKGR